MTDKQTPTDAAAPECLTCSDHGAVGNILTAEPCPDCTRLNTQPAPATQPAGAEPPGIQALMCVISSLRDMAHFSDGEGGELMSALCALRDWAHAQPAPADAKALAEADRRAGEAERLLATCKEDVMRFEQVRSRMKYQWGADQRVSFDEVWDEALALKKAAQADSVQEDAAHEAIEKVLALFPFKVPIQKFTVNNGPCLTADNDDEFYSVKRVLAFLTEIKTTLDAARKQGASR